MKNLKSGLLKTKIPVQKNKLKFKFRYHDGLLVDFNTLPASPKDNF